jgi:hypothetical protein
MRAFALKWVMVREPIRHLARCCIARQHQRSRANVLVMQIIIVSVAWQSQSGADCRDAERHRRQKNQQRFEEPEHPSTSRLPRKLI